MASPPPVAEDANPSGVPETPTAATLEAIAAIAVRTNAYFIVEVWEYITNDSGRKANEKIKETKRTDRMETEEWNGVENKSRCGTYIAAIFSFLTSDTMAQGARMPQRKWFRSHMEEINIWVPAVEMPPPITRRLLLREVDRQ